jgi:hypothetical protein
MSVFMIQQWVKKSGQAVRDGLRQVEKISFGETSTTKPKIGPSNWNKDKR